MSAKGLFAAVALAAAVTGFGLHWLARPTPRVDAPTISAAALYAASFLDERGTSRSLGQFQGKLLVLNFWATWCGPCRAEIPAFTRAQSRWAERGVQFLGLSAEERAKVDGFAREISVNYPLWVGQGVDELGRRLGNRRGFLPFTVIVGPAGEILDAKVGAYSEGQIDAKLAQFAGK